MSEYGNSNGAGWLIAYIGVMAMMIVSPSFFVAETATEIGEFTASRLKELAQFYIMLVVALLVVVNYYRKDARIPDTKTVSLNFLLTWLVSTLILIIVFTMIAAPNWYFALTDVAIGKGSFMQWSVVSFSEGLALILAASLISWGRYSASDSIAYGNVLGVPYNIPNFRRIRYGIPAAAFMALLHFGAYRGSVSSMFVAFVMFLVFWTLRESFGFGSAEGLHFGWNFAIAWVFGGI